MLFGSSCVWSNSLHSYIRYQYFSKKGYLREGTMLPKGDKQCPPPYTNALVRTWQILIEKLIVRQLFVSLKITTTLVQLAGLLLEALVSFRSGTLPTSDLAPSLTRDRHKYSVKSFHSDGKTDFFRVSRQRATSG